MKHLKIFIIFLCIMCFGRTPCGAPVEEGAAVASAPKIDTNFQDGTGKMQNIPMEGAYAVKHEGKVEQNQPDDESQKDVVIAEKPLVLPKKENKEELEHSHGEIEQPAKSEQIQINSDELKKSKEALENNKDDSTGNEHKEALKNDIQKEKNGEQKASVQDTKLSHEEPLIHRKVKPFSMYTEDLDIPNSYKMGSYFLVGISSTAIMFIIFKVYRMRLSRAERKYGVQGNRANQELTPLPMAIDDLGNSDEEDHTLFDRHQLRIL